MIAEELKLVIKTEVAKAVRDIKKFKTETDKAKTATGKLKDHLGKFAKLLKTGFGIGVAVMAIRRMTQSMRQLVDAYGIQEQAEQGFRAALMATGRAAEISSGGIFQFASELQKVTTYGDEATLAAMTLVQSLANLDEKGLRQVTPAMQDFATGMGVDLQTAASLIGKTLGSTTNALSRYGIVLDATAPKQEKVEALTKALTEKFGGMSAAMAETATGSLQQLGNAFGDLKESMGFAIVEGMRPIVEWLTKVITKMTDVRNLINEIQTIFKRGTTGDYQRDIAAIEERIAYLTEQRKKTIHPGTRIAMRKEIEQLEHLLKAKKQQLEIDQEAYLLEQADAAQAVREAERLRERGALLTQYTEALEEATKWQFKQLSPQEQELQILQQEIDSYALLRNALREAGMEYGGLQDFINALVIERDKLIASLEIEKKLMGEIAVAQLAWAGAGKPSPGLPAGMGPHVGGQGVHQLGFLGPGKEMDIAAPITPWPDFDELNAALQEANVWIQKNADALGRAANEAERLKEAMGREFANTVLQYLGGITDAMGALIVGAEDAGEAMRRAFKDAIATAIEALAKLAFAEAAYAAAAQRWGKAIALGAAGVGAMVAAGAVRAMAEGGMVTKPTLALLGEKGPEVVTPLSKSGNVGGITIIQNVEGSVVTERELQGLALSAVAGAQRGY